VYIILIVDGEILIEKVRQYDEVHNMAHRKYSDNHHKDTIWAKIRKELNTNDVCNFVIDFINLNLKSLQTTEIVDHNLFGIISHMTFNVNG